MLANKNNGRKPPPPEYNDADDNPEDAELNLNTVDQKVFERSVAAQASEHMSKKLHDRDDKLLEKTTLECDKLKAQLQSLQAKLQISSRIPTARQLDQVDRLSEALSTKESERKSIETRIAKRKIQEEQEGGHVEEIDEREYLIRTGKITPFSNQAGLAKDDEWDQDELPANHQTLSAPGFRKAANVSTSEASSEADIIFTPRRKRKVKKEEDSDDYVDQGDSYANSDEEYIDEKPRKRRAKQEDADDLGGDANGSDTEVEVQDDGDEELYQKRVRHWEKERSRAREREGKQETIPGLPEYRQPHPTHADWNIKGGLKLPGDIHTSLFDYQKSAVRWFWELHTQKVGGILGDEMGLGKTVQMIAFLAGLHYSGFLGGKPILIVAPATLMKQWVSEFHRWWPAMRAIILHSSGNGKKMNDSDFEEDDEEYDLVGRPIVATDTKLFEDLVNRVFQRGHVLVTTYSSLLTNGHLLQNREWGYVVLDEGHRIRNPDAGTTQAAKSLQTTHRIILSGTPIQNSMTELWSIVDFVHPGHLGTLPTFNNEFGGPIKSSNYANASETAIQTGVRAATALKEMIDPFLMRRLKADVAADLPKKSEKVVFCDLSDDQVRLYLEFLESENMKSVLDGKKNRLYAIDALRKICNHPDLMDRDHKMKTKGFEYGDWRLSGKMITLAKILQHWRKYNHRTLIFAQTRQMLDILEKFIRKQGYKYLRLDGNVNITERQPLVDKFNKDQFYEVFLLTTKVGGLGLNLTGANRVVIFDPDWNPSTDIQARERAWRLGQKKEVTIYRLMTGGTIEEKVYHRQIYKTLLSQKVLENPNQAGLLKMEEMYDLFTLGNYDPENTYTSVLLKQKQQNDEEATLSNMEGVAGIEDLKYEGNGDEATNGRMGPKDVVEGLLGSELASRAASLRSDTREAKKAIASVNKAKNAITKSSDRTKQTLQKSSTFAPTWTGKSGKAGITQEEINKKEEARIAREHQAFKAQKKIVWKKPASLGEMVKDLRVFLGENPRATATEIVKRFDKDIDKLKMETKDFVALLQRNAKKNKSGVWEVERQGVIPNGFSNKYKG